jgi:DNA-directed RNA polymerase specialized sigma24 family protein
VIHGVDHEALVAFLVGLVGPDDAEDVASETYLAALTAAPHDGRASAWTWMCAIAKRQAANWRRKRDRRTVAEANGPAPILPTSVDWAVLLAELDEGDRVLVETRLALGTEAATARALALTRGQVRYRWGRLLRRVR